MIYLKTGQPGHGKTLRAIWQALEFQKQGRTVYAYGIKGLKYEEAGFIELKDPTRWMDCPPGSVILIDECYRVFPMRGGTGKVPPHVDLMATHRHQGYDFILVCQSPSKQVDRFLHDLIDHHEHIRRKFGFKKAIILWWDRFEPNVRRSDTKKFWSYPADLMKRNLYVSTEQDTTERRIPWFIYAFPVAFLVLGLCLWKVNAFFHPEAGKSATPVPGVAVPQADSKPANDSKPKRPEDLVRWLKPRLAGQPWSAPAFDDRPVVSEPELYCIAVDDGRCSCITEQGTRYEVEPNMCRALARGGSYNPTRRPAQPYQSQPAQQAVQPAQAQPVASASMDGASGGYKPGVGAEAYQPPGTMPWNSDPWGSKTAR